MSEENFLKDYFGQMFNDPNIELTDDSEMILPVEETPVEEIEETEE